MRKKAMLIWIAILLIGGIFVLTVLNKRFLFTKENTHPHQLIHSNKSLSQDSIDLTQAKDQDIQQLALLQKTQKGYVTNNIAISEPLTNIFIDPLTNADSISQKLTEFKKFNITPIVLITISSIAENHNTFEELQSKESLNKLSLYFQELKKDDVTDTMMGTWIFFPNANLISGQGSIPTPESYISLTNNYQTVLASIFPKTQRSMLLASQTSSNTNIPNGSSQTLLPYLQGIKPGLINSFGIQGFPWIQPMHGGNALPDLDPSIFLNYNLATNAAHLLHVKKIWFRTGAFSKMYTNNPSQTVTLLAQDRMLILQNIYEQARLSREKGYQVSINIVIEDESSTTEATDWSFTQDPQIFHAFLGTLTKNDMPLSLSMEGALLN